MPGTGVGLRGVRRTAVVVVALSLVTTVVWVVVLAGRGLGTSSAGDHSPDRPPPPGGYFETLPAGSWRDLPGDRRCAERVRRSAWEPRPDNVLPNHRRPDPAAVRRAFRERPRATQGAYAEQWDRWLLPRVSGQFTGTTDEVLQWAACKWGVADNVLRAVAVRESGWYQYQVYPDGSCVVGSGCGDLFEEVPRSARRYCTQVAASFSVRAREAVQEHCPRTFSILGVMAWHDPQWGRMPGNQNGTFPFTVDSTAFAADYYGAFVRGCLEGWVRWLANTGAYQPGDLGGCLGAWYAGAWDSVEARDYRARVAAEAQARTWLDSDWVRSSLPCSPDRGCPEASP